MLKVSSTRIRSYRVDLFIDPNAIVIARELDRLPLALVIVGIYLD